MCARLKPRGRARARAAGRSASPRARWKWRPASGADETERGAGRSAHGPTSVEPCRAARRAACRVRPPREPPTRGSATADSRNVAVNVAVNLHGWVLRVHGRRKRLCSLYLTFSPAKVKDPQFTGCGRAPSRPARRSAVAASRRHATPLGGGPIPVKTTPREQFLERTHYPSRSPLGDRTMEPMTGAHAHGPPACARLCPTDSAQGVRKWQG